MFPEIILRLDLGVTSPEVLLKLYTAVQVIAAMSTQANHLVWDEESRQSLVSYMEVIDEYTAPCDRIMFRYWCQDQFGFFSGDFDSLPSAQQ